MARNLLLAVVVCATAAAQGSSTGAIGFTVGDINLYGFHKVSPERVLNLLQLKPGVRLPPSKGELEDRVNEISGVVLANITAVCCDGSRIALFIGIEERGAPHAQLRSAPSGDATLPESLVASYQRFLAAVQHAASKGNDAEDLTAGESRMADPGAQALQVGFAGYAADNLDKLRDVLRNAAEPEERAAAAAIIGYAPKKAAVVDDLQYALQDPNGAVRANALRSLSAIAVLAVRQPELGLRISPTWLVELLNSIELDDRVESVKALLTLTDKNGAATLDLLRERGMSALAEMARWKTPRYALPPFLLLARAAGMTDEQAQQTWEKGDREAAIEKALKK